MEKLAPGTSLGPYAVIEPLSQGGFASVYRAFDERLGRRVVLKVLDAGDGAAARRFAHEARALTRLASPHVMPLLDAQVDGDRLWLVAPDSAAVSLAAFAKQGRARVLRGETSAAALAAGWLRILADVLRGLEAMHGAGMIHRDIKPANILVLPDGRAQLADLGLVLTAGQVRVTAEGDMVGTMEFLPPESALESEVDHRADLYQWALVARWLYTGTLPFEEAMPTAAMLRRVTEGCPAVALEPLGAPRGLSQLVARNLSTDPDERHRGAAELREALDALARPRARAAVRRRFASSAPVNRGVLVPRRAGLAHAAALAIGLAAALAVGLTPRARLPVRAAVNASRPTVVEKLATRPAALSTEHAALRALGLADGTVTIALRVPDGPPVRRAHLSFGLCAVDAGVEIEARVMDRVTVKVPRSAGAASTARHAVGWAGVDVDPALLAGGTLKVEVCAHRRHLQPHSWMPRLAGVRLELYR